MISENGRVLGAVTALRRRDFDKLGHLLDLSHASLRDDFEVSTPAVEETVAQAQGGRGLGARVVGGGFGGNVLGADAAGHGRARWRDRGLPRSGRARALVARRS